MRIYPITRQATRLALVAAITCGVAACTEENNTFDAGDTNIAGDNFESGSEQTNNTDSNNNNNSGNNTGGGGDGGTGGTGGGDAGNTNGTTGPGNGTSSNVNVTPTGAGLPSARGTNAGGSAFVIAPSSSTIADAAISGRLIGDYRLTNDRVWEIRGGVFVGEDSGIGSTSNGRTARLTIDPGTVIVSDDSDSDAADVLIVTRGSQILANGTATAPIVFTVPDESNDARSQWGGLVINGNAPINNCNDGMAAAGQSAGGVTCTTQGEGGSGLYGGDQPTDNSGILRYVVVKFAGIQFGQENELNGIALQGVGSGTTVEYVQIHRNFDDGIEFFGGTVDAKYLYLTGNGDDSLDWTSGWVGRVQHVIVEQATDGGDNGFEADNQEDTDDALPRSAPTIFNITVLGQANTNEGMRIREGTSVNLGNVIIDGSGDSCLNIDDASTYNNGGATAADAQAGDQLTIVTSIVGTCGEAFADDAADPWLVSDWFAAGTGNQQTAPQLDGNAQPVAGSPAIGNGTNPATIDGYFDSVDHIGGLSPTSDWRSGWAVDLNNVLINTDNVGGGATGGNASGLPMDLGTNANGGPFVVSASAGSGADAAISGRLVGNYTLTNDRIWELRGGVFIGEDAGIGSTSNGRTGVLTIQAGTTIIADDADSDAADVLVVTRGSQLIADGSATAPIVFTVPDEGNDARSQWGGLVINGNAPINNCNDGAAAPGQDAAGNVCATQGEGGSGLYGGDQPGDNSGILRYVLVKFAGIQFGQENELNGIAFQGVGNGTTVDFIQVHRNFDDGVEFFGGTVDAKHVYLTGNGDDSLDWTSGWVGRVQHVIVEQATDGGDNGVEADNQEDTDDALPRSAPSIFNLTVLGQANTNEGLRIREGTATNLGNVIVDGAGDSCLNIDDTRTYLNGGATAAAAQAGDQLTMVTSIVGTCGEAFADDASDPWLVSDWFNVAAAGNQQADPQLGADGQPMAGSPALGNGTDPSMIDTFFDAADHIGALDGTTDWRAGWAVDLDNNPIQ